MFFPYGTTCYSERAPVATYLLLAANVLVHVAGRAGWIDPEAWTLVWDEPTALGFFGSAFLQESWGHLAWNLIYLWLLGRIVEGTVGARAFLLLCLAIVVGSNGLELALLHGREGGSLGASGLAFGLLAAAFLIAPRSRVHWGMWLRLRWRTFDMGLGGFAALVLFVELLRWGLGGLQPGAALLHLVGALVGALVALPAVRFGWVDTGGWDWFSVRSRQRPR